MKRVLTGIRPTGDLHLGNYLAALRPGLRLQDSYHCMYFLADLHALTTSREPEKLHEYTFDLLATLVALGMDYKRTILYRQSDVPEVTELAWYLSCVTGVGYLEKAHAYKDAAQANKEVNHGVFAYPVLMAADILLYDPDLVPVGKDQKQHVEMARNMAGSLNALFGEVLKLPDPLIEEDVMLVPGLDGRKMSKSYNNYIPLFCEEKELRKKVMSIKTDSTPVESPKELKGSLVGDLFKLFASDERYVDLEKRLAAGGLGWGHAKEELFEAINATVTEPRRVYSDLRADRSALRSILAEGQGRAREIGSKVLERVRHAVGIRP